MSNKILLCLLLRFSNFTSLKSLYNAMLQYQLSLVYIHFPSLHKTHLLTVLQVYMTSWIPQQLINSPNSLLLQHQRLSSLFLCQLILSYLTIRILSFVFLHNSVLHVKLLQTDLKYTFKTTIYFKNMWSTINTKLQH